jgi:uncharacterized membrane protein
MSQTTDEGKACAVLSYILIGIVWFFLDKKIRRNTFARFHVKQAIVFIIFLLIVTIIVAAFSLISGVFGRIVEVLLYLAMGIIWIIQIINAAAGKEKKMPVIGLFAKEIDF